MFISIAVFFVFNFGALAAGSAFTGKGVPSDWYQSLNRAPWTPPGWVFGVAWFTVMVCFTGYMAIAWQRVEDHGLLLGLYVSQLILNILWNPVFFYFRNTTVSLALITGLTILMAFFLFYYWVDLNLFSLLVLPYVIWLIIATSLNGYILVKN